ncbi:MAG: hypothetical protein AB1640_19540 [bacterium]
MAVNIVEKVDDPVPIRHALVSVSDKQEIDFLVRDLVDLLPELTIYSTGGTFSKIREILGDRSEGRLVQVSDYTGQPETQGGLVKTLDFKIYLGLLTETYNEEHQQDLERTAGVPIDLVVVNLYPFRQTIQQAGVTLEKARANIDIGGPCMIRAAAKNYLRVAVLVDPRDYAPFLAALRQNQGSSRLEDRFRLAAKAFEHTAAYDRMIADYFARIRFPAASKCYSILHSDR